MTMIDFMLIGLPRSGTTWLANLLNTDYTTCEHDPLNLVHYSRWDESFGDIPGRVSCGVSCTGIWRWHDWVVNHPAKKIIIHRNPREVEKSLAELDIPMDLTGWETLFDIPGLHVNFEDLFIERVAKRIWEQVTVERFNPFRFNILSKMSIQPHLSGVAQDEHLQRHLYRELEDMPGGIYKRGR